MMNEDTREGGPSSHKSNDDDSKNEMQQQKSSKQLGLDGDFDDDASKSLLHNNDIPPQLQSLFQQDIEPIREMHSPGQPAIEYHESDLLSTSEDGNDDKDDDEPKLKYQRLTSGLADLLRKDSVSCMATSDRFLALGTHGGVIHILDLEGNDVKRFHRHSATVNQLSIDTHGEFLASASDDGRVVINSLYASEEQSFNYKRPVKAVAVEPDFSKKSTRHFVSGGMAELLNLSGKGWFANKDVVLHSGEGPIYAIQWQSTQIAWANDAGVKIYDTTLQQRFAYIDRPIDSPRADLYRCNLCWKSDTELLIGWADSVKVCVIKERSKFDIASGLPPKYVEIVSQFRTDWIVSGIAPFNNMLVILAFVTDLNDSKTVDVLQNSPFKRKKSKAPEIFILDSQGEEVANDLLTLNQFEHFQANDYRLEYAPIEPAFFIVSPKDVVVAKPRGLEDHIEWLLERKRYEEALRAAEKAGESYGGRLQVANILDIGQKYMNNLMGEGKYSEVASLCPKILRSNVALWEHWIMAFDQANQIMELKAYIPVKNPTLSSRMYELILARHLGAHAYDEFLETIKSWPFEAYDVNSVIKAVEDELTNEPSNKHLNEAALELYTQNKQFDQALLQSLKLRQPDSLNLIWRHNLYGFISSRAMMVLEYDQAMLGCRQFGSFAIAGGTDSKSEPDEADMGISPTIAAIRNAVKSPGVQILVQNIDRIPISRVVHQIKSNSKFLHIYLDALYRKDSAAGAEYHPIQVELYAEYDYERLLSFLKTSTYYPLRKAYEVCETRDYIPELVYLLGKMGNNRKALFLIIERLGDVRQAIEFAKEQNDEELWNDLMKYSMDKPEFIVGLLENLGSVIDPIRLIRQIPPDLEIPGLRAALIKVLYDYGVQMSLREGCERILLSDTVELLSSLQRAQKRGMAFNPDVTCAVCGGQIFENFNPSIAMVAFFCRHVYHYSCLTEGKVPNTLNVVVNAFSNERVVRTMSLLYARPGYNIKEPTAPSSGIAHTPHASDLDKSIVPIRKDNLSCPLCGNTKHNIKSIGNIVGGNPLSSGSMPVINSNSSMAVAAATISASKLPPIVKQRVQAQSAGMNVSKAGTNTAGISGNNITPPPYRAPTPVAASSSSSGSKK